MIALLGDGALTGGLAYEGLNDAGASGEPLIVILNDNNMSIAQNVGGISRHLARARLKPGYFGFKKAIRRFTQSVPGGKHLHAMMHGVKNFLKHSLLGTTVFEKMGLTYLGPVDGHDVDKIAYLLNQAREMNCPVLVHIITQKGKGYRPAEIAPQVYHGVGHFDPSEGIQSEQKPETFSRVFGQTLAELAEKDKRICAITAAMQQGTGLSKFAERFPERFFDVGIAEGHAVSMAAGLASGGMIPVVALYSTFLQRAYDMILHDVALMQNHVVFAVDRSGLVGEDGATHHGVFDIGYLRQVPGMTLLAPATADELRQMLTEAVTQYSGPVAIRYPRGNCMVSEDICAPEPTSDPEITLVTYGTMIRNVLDAAELLKAQGICVNVIRITRLMPLETDLLLKNLAPSGRCAVIEDAVNSGCVGQEIAAALSATSGKVELINLGQDFVAHGDMGSLLRAVNLDANSICSRIMEVLRHEE